ncbi:hypothetical protein D3C86_2138750 [compost metagenome]
MRRMSRLSEIDLRPSVVLITSCTPPFFIESTICGRPSSTLLTLVAGTLLSTR